MSKNLEKYTVTDVAGRFEEAAYTIKRLPPVKIKAYGNTWPDVVRTTYEKMQEEKLPTRLGPPAADAISRLEEAMDWICWLDSEDERRLVWMRTERIAWKRICWRIGYGRTKAWQMWVICVEIGALLKIVTRLNAEK